MQQNSEEELAAKEVEQALRPVIDRFLTKVYSTLSWCWPATIMLFVVQQILRSIGYYGLSLWGVTIFLWAPFAIIIGAAAIFVGFFYLLSLFASWTCFIHTAAFYFKLGFTSANKEEKKE